MLEQNAGNTIARTGVLKAIYSIYFVLVILLDSITDSITSTNANTITK